MVLFVSAAAGWIIALVIQKIIMNRLPLLLKNAGSAIRPELFPLNDIRSKIYDTNSVQNIMPLIEAHIDEFLRHKLGKAMPMIGMFIGDKTIAQLKSVFIQELEELFPVIMDKYADDLFQKLDIHSIIREKLAAVPVAELNVMIRTSMGKELSMIPIAGLIAGALIGLLQVFVLTFIS
jgi:uncharacterized membrane protein YheB (UPF0754 family)